MTFLRKLKKKNNKKNLTEKDGSVMIEHICESDKRKKKE